MTPNEKAIEIYDKSYQNLPLPDCKKKNIAAKNFGLILCNEIIKVAPIDLYDHLCSEYSIEEVGVEMFEEYWKEVRKELEKL